MLAAWRLARRDDDEDPRRLPTPGVPDGERGPGQDAQPPAATRSAPRGPDVLAAAPRSGRIFEWRIPLACQPEQACGFDHGGRLEGVARRSDPGGGRDADE